EPSAKFRLPIDGKHLAIVLHDSDDLLLLGRAFLLRSGHGIDDPANRQVELLREFEIALVMRRHGHNGSGTVARKHIVGDEDGNLLLSCWINRVHALDTYAG